MEGASSGLAGHLDDILPKEAQFVLAWNPPQLSAEEEEDVILHAQEPPDTAASASQTTAIGSSRKAAFYDRHLASHLILERVVYFDTLVSAMANTVDQAIQDAVAKRPLPKKIGVLLSEDTINHQVRAFFRRTAYRETGVAEFYKDAATYCLPIASTLALHPSSEDWDSILNWTTDGKIGGWEISDGVLLISRRVFKDDRWKQQLLQNEDDEKNGIMEQLAFRSTALALWEIKSLSVGTSQVMQEIVEMGVTHAKFPWKKCTLTVCNHRFWEGTEEPRESYDAGFDARSPPWTLPIVPSASAADSRPTSLHKSLMSATTQGGTTGLAPTPVKRRRGNPPMATNRKTIPVGTHKIPTGTHRKGAAGRGAPPKKSKEDSMDELYDELYEPPPGARKEVNAQLFLQQAWAQAVRNKCTIMVLHSGNHEIIGIRHRETQTLYISHVIEPHSCSNPAYGKVQVGIYIAAIRETMDRARQDIEAREKTQKTARDPPVDISLKDEEADPDADLGDYSPKGPTGSNKRSSGSATKGKRQRRHEGSAKRHASEKVIDDRALLSNAATHNRLCLRFLFDIYDSPHPAAFRRIPDRPKEATVPAVPPTSPLSAGHETTPPFELTEPSIHITVHSELQPGSTGIVHIGTMALDPSGPTAKVAVKLALSRDEKSQLTNEHRVYSYLHSKRVQGIPCDVGLFVDEEPLLGAEGPYALVMTYAGVSLFRRYKLASNSVKDSLLATLKSIHEADILHGDIRLPNFCITPSGEAFVVDFSHATKSRSRKEKAQEIRELTHILEMDSPTKPAAKKCRFGSQ